MRLNATSEQTAAILGSMAAVASIRGPSAVTPADRASVLAAARYLLGAPHPADPFAADRVLPQKLAAALAGSETLARDAAHLLTVMAFVDGTLDRARIDAVLEYAAALGIDEPYVDDVARAAHGELRRALADMTRRNLESVTNRPWPADDADQPHAMAWFLPYRDQPDRALHARYQSLGDLPEGTFGLAYFRHYRANGYALPGAPAALNEAFATPHDSVHVLAGYDTSPRGEILTSTFTAAMHPSHPMAGHVLPVLLSWHLGIEINAVARSASGALDPVRFWEAWARGAAIGTDLFAPGRDFWLYVAEPLDALREQLAIPPLDARAPGSAW
ncbi:MAG: hypothetical protein AB1689_20270 [Thermodesulfobacteriota bacterium]